MAENKKTTFRFKLTANSDTYSAAGMVPFTFVSNSSGVPTDGYQAGLISGFGSTKRFDINGLHNDTYETDFEIPVQSVFTERFVGGSSHRHTEINHYSSTKTGPNYLDSTTTRAEPFDLVLSAGTIQISPRSLTNPRTNFFRETHAKRPVNIANISTQTGSIGTKIGNYNITLDVVSTTGRSTNDLSFSDTQPQTSSIASPYISGAFDYAKLQRTTQKSIIVNRFSSPGDPSTAGDNLGGVGLDAEHSEVSPYNALPFRNLMVRIPLTTLLSTHEVGHGLASGSVLTTSGYTGTASFHEVPGNRLKVISSNSSGYVTSSQYDNFYVQHQIPRNDLQYSWITGTATVYGGFNVVNGNTRVYDNVPFGFIPEDGLITVNGTSSAGIQFNQGATVENSSILTPYASLNINVITPIDIQNNTIGLNTTASLGAYFNIALNSSLSSNATARALNPVLTTRGGSFRNSTWHQIRNQDSRLVNALRRNNIVSHTPKYGEEQNTPGRSINPTNQTTYRFSELPVRTNNLPVKINATKIINNTPINFTIDITHNNEMVSFANSKLNSVLQTKTFTPDRISQIKEFIQSEDIELNNLKFAETVYPSNLFVGSIKIRNRNNFDNNFWKDSRTDRTAKGILAKHPLFSQSTNITQSSWALDAGADFSTSTILTGASNLATSKAGILQNCYYQVHGATKSDTLLAPLYSRKHTLGAKYSFVNIAGVRNSYTSSLGTIGSMPTTYFSLGNGQIFGGEALWEASRLSGYVDSNGNFVSQSRTPFYDTYEKFNENVKVHNSDMTLIPEFRISKHIDYYTNTNQGNFLSDNTASLDIFGINAITSSSDYTRDSSEADFYKIYSTSDLFENLGDKLKELKDDAEPSAVKLKFKAIKKFVPYDGFYPAERTIDIATQFSKSHGRFIKSFGTDTGSLESNTTSSANLIRPLWSAMFAPGILYNTIKSGIAVDYPVYTGSKEIVQVLNQNLGDGYTPTGGTTTTGYYLLGTGSRGTNGFDYRIPFEALASPSKYLKNIYVSDMEPHPSCSYNLTASWDGEGDDLYTLMANNFLAETVNFYLERGEMASLVSQPQASFKKFKPGETYGMRVRLRRSMNSPRQFLTFDSNTSAFTDSVYPSPQDNVLQCLGIGDGPLLSFKQTQPLQENFTMYSRPSAFGPPMAARRLVDTSSGGGGAALDEFAAAKPDSLFGYDWAFTPPYYYGEAWADVIFTATSSKHTLDDIFANSTVVNWRIDSASFWPTGTVYNQTPYGEYANNFAMQITSSVNILGKAAVRTVEYDASGNPLTIKDDKLANDQVWVIQPKFETPTLNFNDTGPRALLEADITIPTNGSESVPRGMWHQFGTIPDSPNKGIFLEVSDINDRWLKNRASADTQTSSSYNGGKVKSLIDVVGFQKQSTRIGKIASSKTIYEAVVAIPFVERSGQRRFFKLNKELVANAAKVVASPNYKFSDKDVIPGQSMVDLVARMNKYVIPPKFDFVNNPDAVDPISMYVFEFSHTFTQNDLVYMWQNLAPDIGVIPEFSESEITHELAGNEILSYISSTGKKNSDLKWLVFKVKQRAETNYYDKLLAENLKTDPRFKNVSNKVGKRENDRQIPFYSYNWPYDFFTMIEYGKMDFEVEAKPKAGSK